MSKSDPTGLDSSCSGSGGSTSCTVTAPRLPHLVIPGVDVFTQGRVYGQAIYAYQHPNSAIARNFASRGISFARGGMATPSADSNTDDVPDPFGTASGLQRSILPPGGMERAFRDFYGPQLQLGMLAFGGVLGKIGEAGEVSKGVLEGAKFAQKTFSSMFSGKGAFAGRSIEEIAAALKAGTLNPADVPVHYIVRDGNTLMLNTQSAQALT